MYTQSLAHLEYCTSIGGFSKYLCYVSLCVTAEKMQCGCCAGFVTPLSQTKVPISKLIFKGVIVSSVYDETLLKVKYLIAQVGPPPSPI